MLSGWLPADRARGVAFIGFAAQESKPIAAFAVAPPVDRYTPPGLAFAFHVQPQFAEAEIDVQMLALADRMAASASLGPLYAWPHPVAHTVQAARFERLGFEVFDRIRQWDAPGREGLHRLNAMLDRVRTRHPKHRVWAARDVPLPEASVDAVLDLYESGLANTGGLRDDMKRRLRGEGANAFCRLRSRVLILDQSIVGVLLAEIVGRIAWTRAIVVSPDFRDGLANLRLLHAAITADQPVIPERILRFETLDSHPTTRRAANRLRATQSSERWKMRRNPTE